jgi:hypothetical protein
MLLIFSNTKDNQLILGFIRLQIVKIQNLEGLTNHTPPDSVKQKD